MGYDLPAAIGAAVAREGKRVICLAGDGSLQLNIQELQTLAANKLPVKLFVLNNNGYLSIRTSQKGFFGSTVGESPASGISFPNFEKLANAYGLAYIKLDMKDFESRLQTALATRDRYCARLCLILIKASSRARVRVNYRMAASFQRLLKICFPSSSVKNCSTIC